MSDPSPTNTTTSDPAPTTTTRSGPSHITLMGSGFAAGVVVSGLLNPFDRALFLSVAKRRPFLHRCNWRNPYQGVGQSIVGRALSTGMWFSLERTANDTLRSHSATAELSPNMRAAMSGQMAGGANALILSPLTYVKFQTWGLPESQRSFHRTALKVVREAGPSAFSRGLPATVIRDCIFGGLFGWTRTKLRRAGTSGKDSPSAGIVHRFVSDAAAAGVATVVSAPFNFARNLQFAQPIADRPMSTADALRALWREEHMVRRLNLGWGTLRVAAGMALTACFFDTFLWLGTERR
jgi:hypothetical protein